MEIDLEKEYVELKKRYPKLPSFNEININFELSIFEPRIANNSLFARYMRKVCSSYMENFCSFLQNLLNPNPSFLLGISESKFFNEKDRANLILITQQNMALIRWASANTVIYKEEREIEAIIKFNDQMKKNKVTLQEIFNKLKEGWEKIREQKKEEPGNYFG